MSSVKKPSGVMLATAAAAMLSLGMVPAVQAGSHSGGAVKCSGANSCKGQSACATASTSCAGQNACKGQGWLKLSAADCEAAGGSAAAKKSEAGEYKDYDF